MSGWNQEIWQRLLAKLVFEQATERVKPACGSVQLYAGLEVGNEGTLHAVWKWATLEAKTEVSSHSQDKEIFSLAESHFSQELVFIDCACPSDEKLVIVTDPPELNARDGFTMIDVANGFNELSQMAMLWTVCHLWSKGSRFAFNCYCHEVILIVQNPGHSPIILWSCGSITQGNPMAMILYSAALVPLVEILQQAFLDVKQLWYADNVLEDTLQLPQMTISVVSSAPGSSGLDFEFKTPQCWWTTFFKCQRKQ